MLEDAPPSKRQRTADSEEQASAPLPQPTLPPPKRPKSSGVRASARLAQNPLTPNVATPPETPSITVSEQHDDGSQDDGSQEAPDAGASRGGSNTLRGKELIEEALKIVNNADTAELMILELMNKYSFSFPRLKELLRGKPVTPFFLVTLNRYWDQRLTDSQKITSMSAFPKSSMLTLLRR
jgi:hypothetical protein